ncbi:O-antigen polymerase [Sporolactobacillus laevolacticus]|uniref:O-antigen polymerase n=1 Tax=Sporolactobacillus laevolacticus TaxID=33018 RepID=UPI0025B4F399|nr:O-antigen polymerase [Sporolactobacillus laevolacticus]MDN3954748.1 O-antigen polymerase [Sporolactobacillus laevolacticus]
MIYSYLILTILLTLISWILSRDVVSPPFIMGIIWSIMYFLLCITRYQIDSENIYYSIFFIGYFLFTIGYFLTIKIKINRNIIPVYFKDIEIEIKSTNIYIFFIVEAIVTLYLFITIFLFLRHNFIFNIWFSIKYGQAVGTYHESQFITMFRVLINCITCIFQILYLLRPSKKLKKIFLVQFLFGMLFAFTSMGRTFIFQLFIPLFVIYILIKGLPNKKIFKTYLYMFIVLFAFFIAYAYLKFPYKINQSGFLSTQLDIYATSPMIAFVNWCNSSPLYLDGANTFRFFLAIWNSIGYDVTVPDLIQKYVYVGNDLTNVYTVYFYTAMDFGILYSLIYIFFVGCFNGFLFKKIILAHKNKVFWICFTSQFYFPLFMQFFQDQYISLLSQWIQYAFWIYLIVKSGYFYKIKEFHNEKIKTINPE